MDYREKRFTGERALYAINNSQIKDCIFADGESPLKECTALHIVGSQFEWKYPLWYCKHVTVEDSIIHTMGRAGIWYTDDIVVKDTTIQAPKQFRRCNDVTLRNVHFSNAAETMWNCNEVIMSDVDVSKGDYFAMNCSNMSIDNLSLDGNYAFDGAKNVEIRNSKLLTKDAFWNAENITIYDSFITGEYFGWNSKNIKLVNCTIESLQGFCYMDNIVLENCKLLNTTLAFEYSSNIDADVSTKIDSVVNPISGKITSRGIETYIVDEFTKCGNDDELAIITK